MSQILAIPADALARMNMLVNASRFNSNFAAAKPKRMDYSAKRPNQSSSIKNEGKSGLSKKVPA